MLKKWWQTEALPLGVVAGCGSDLLGRGCLQEIPLEWRDIHRVNMCEARLLQELLGRHEDIYNLEVGSLMSTQAKIHADHNTPSRSFKLISV